MATSDSDEVFLAPAARRAEGEDDDDRVFLPRAAASGLSRGSRLGRPREPSRAGSFSAWLVSPEPPVGFPPGAASAHDRLSGHAARGDVWVLGLGVCEWLFPGTGEGAECQSLTYRVLRCWMFAHPTQVAASMVLNKGDGHLLLAQECGASAFVDESLGVVADFLESRE